MNTCSTNELSDFICQWQELSDTVYDYIKGDPAFHSNTSLKQQFRSITDSVRTDLMKLASGRTLEDVAYIKLHTSPFRDDTSMDSMKIVAEKFFKELDRQSILSKRDPIEEINLYRQFLFEAREAGIHDQKQLMDFLKQEDLHFQLFLSNIDRYSDMNVSDLTMMTEQICMAVYQQVNQGHLHSNETIVFMSMRLDRRLLQNASVCQKLLMKGKVNTPQQANAYFWMTVQPYLAMDPSSITMLTEQQKETMMSIATSYPQIIDVLARKQYCDRKRAEEIPTQLLRLYISTL